MRPRPARLAALCLAVVGAALPARGESPACPLLLGEGGQPSDLDGCALTELLARADLRRHLSACVRRALEVSLPTPARLEFRLALHPGGGAERVELLGGGRADLLGRCTLRVLAARLHGGQEGRPAVLQGWLRLPGDEPERFAFGLSAMARAAPPPAPPLPGRFQQSPAGPLSACPLGGRLLVLRLGGGGEAPELEPSAPTDPRVEACRTPPVRPRPLRGRPAPRPEACLEELLRAPQLALRADAAEALARGRRWRSGRAIERSLVDILQPAGEASQPLRVPADEASGLAALRMLESALALYRRPPAAAFEALAAHPAAAVRLRLLTGALARHRGDVGGALRTLGRAAEPLLRARAQQLGCLRGDPESLRAVREDLAHPQPAVRAQAVLLARACARRATPEVLAAAAREPAGLLALMLLQAAPAGSEAEVRRLAPAALEDACPAARFLAAHLLARLPAPPREPILAALERERDPLLREGLEALLREPGERGAAPTAQLWLQDPPGDLALPSAGRFE